jgi:hypothetical protein
MLVAIKKFKESDDNEYVGSFQNKTLFNFFTYLIAELQVRKTALREIRILK